MTESLSRSQRLAISAVMAAYAAAYLAAARWLIDVCRDLGPDGTGLILAAIAFIAAPVAFPFWRSTLGSADRQLLFIGSVVGGFLSGLVAAVASLVTLDANLPGPFESPEARLLIAVAGLAGALAGAYFATLEVDRPPAPPGSDEAVREGRAWAELRRKGRRRVLVEQFCFGLFFMLVVSSYSSVRNGGWSALRGRWTGPVLAEDIAIAFVLGCWTAYLASVRWDVMARRRPGSGEEMPLTARSA